MPSPEITDLVNRYRQYRNAFELFRYARRELIRACDEIELTDEVIAWALTVSDTNESGDAVAVARHLWAQRVGSRKGVPA